MRLIYDGNWDSLLEYLKEKDCMFFVRKDTIELVLESHSVFIQKEPILFKCKVIHFPKDRINKNKNNCKILAKILAFHR